MTKRVGLILSLSTAATLLGIIAYGLLVSDEHIGPVIGVAAGVWFVAILGLSLTLGRRPIYPDGHRYDATLAGYTAVCIVDKDFRHDDGSELSHEELQRLALLCAEALWRVGETWRATGIVINGVKEPRKVLSGHVFEFVPDDEYEAAWRGDLKPWGPKTSGVRGQIPIFLGGGPFHALIRGSLLDKVMVRGTDIAVHEPVHTVRLWDSHHADERVWIKAARRQQKDPTKTVEAEALKQWMVGAVSGPG